MSERARVDLGGQLRSGHADPRAAVVRMHDGAQAGIGSLPQLAGRAALLLPPRAAADCRGLPLAATVGVQQQASRALRRDRGVNRTLSRVNRTLLIYHRQPCTRIAACGCIYFYYLCGFGWMDGTFVQGDRGRTSALAHG